MPKPAWMELVFRMEVELAFKFIIPLVFSSTLLFRFS